MKSKKIITCIVIVAVIAVLLAAFLLYYSKAKFTVEFTVASPVNTSENHYGMIMVSEHENPLFKPSEEKLNNLLEIYDWLNSADTDVRKYFNNGAYNIEGSGEIKDGKTTLRYKGYVTNENGEQIEYLNEKTFDFTVTDESHFFAN